jgi:hypothetical protein
MYLVPPRLGQEVCDTFDVEEWKGEYYTVLPWMIVNMRKKKKKKVVVQKCVDRKKMMMLTKEQEWIVGWCLMQQVQQRVWRGDGWGEGLQWLNKGWEEEVERKRRQWNRGSRKE